MLSIASIIENILILVFRKPNTELVPRSVQEIFFPQVENSFKHYVLQFTLYTLLLVLLIYPLLLVASKLHSICMTENSLLNNNVNHIAKRKHSISR